MRGVEPRNPRLDLVEPLARQLALVREARLPACFLLQYDALLDSRFVDLLRGQPDSSCEVGGWLEIVEPLARRAGLVWRGRTSWDWRAHVGFTLGYSPAERERLVDAYMAEFRARFGRYPRTVGCWFLDAHTLAYLARRYGVIASCNCRDQLGNDGYTLWGGYWNQAYYPSRRNAFVPAQHAREQIPLVMFRMLGSDPIEQYDAGLEGARSEVITLEPACPAGGGSPAWVRWYFDALMRGPCLAFGYAQVGQENSYGWARMGAGLTDQVRLLAELARAGRVRVETLAASAAWFRSRWKVTPATSVTALEDWRGLGRSSLWYDSRFYRANFYAEAGELRIRDLHLFDERYAEACLVTPTRSAGCLYETLPVMDGNRWSRGAERAGMRPVFLDGEAIPATRGAMRGATRGATRGAMRGATRGAMRGGPLEVTELRPDALGLVWPLEAGGALEVRCAPETLTVVFSGKAQAPQWGLEMRWSPPAVPPIAHVSERRLDFARNGFTWRVRLLAGRLSRDPGAPGLLFRPEGGRLVLYLDSTAPASRPAPRP